MEIRHRGQAKVEVIISFSPFEIVAKDFFRIKIFLEIVQDILLVGRIVETDKNQIVPVSPVIIVFLRVHRHVYDVLQS